MPRQISAISILRKADKWFNSSKRLTRDGSFGHTESGLRILHASDMSLYVSPETPMKCMCSLGAVYYFGKNSYNPGSLRAESLLSNAANEIFNTGIVTVNDLYGFDAVKKVFSRAIEMEDGGYTHETI